MRFLPLLLASLLATSLAPPPPSGEEDPYAVVDAFTTDGLLDVDGLLDLGVTAGGAATAAPTRQRKPRRSASSAPDAPPPAAPPTPPPAPPSRAPRGSAAPRAPPPAAPSFVVPPGRVIEFSSDVRPRAFALLPSRSSILVADGAVHGNKHASHAIISSRGWWGWLTGVALTFGKPAPYPFAYIVSTTTSVPPIGGEVITTAFVSRTLEFVDRSALALGLAESRDARVAITFYQGPGLEVWDASLDLKLTYHELSFKPSLPVFDDVGVLWVPFTIADRLGEEGDGVIALWAYESNGARLEVFARRELARGDGKGSFGIQYPHTIHLDGCGHAAIAGLAEWPFADGIFGQELKQGLDAEAAAAATRLDFYAVTANRNHPAFRAELRARWEELHGTGNGEPSNAELNAVPLTAALALEATFEFPVGYGVMNDDGLSLPLPCLWPLFVLTGDGHAITACYDTPNLRVVRYAYPISPPAGGTNDDIPELISHVKHASALGTRLQLREAWAPPLPPKASTLRFLPSNASHLLADFTSPWGIGSIGGLAMDPSGAAFVILDKAGARIVSAPWPLQGLPTLPVTPMGSAVPRPPMTILTTPPPLPREFALDVGTPPRSTEG